MDREAPARIRIATETLYQVLIDAEATAFIEAGSCERNAIAPRNATAAAPER